MLFDAALASEMAQKLLQRGIFVVGFSYPVRPTLKSADYLAEAGCLLGVQ